MTTGSEKLLKISDLFREKVEKLMEENKSMSKVKEFIKNLQMIKKLKFSTSILTDRYKKLSVIREEKSDMMKKNSNESSENSKADVSINSLFAQPIDQQYDQLKSSKLKENLKDKELIEKIIEKNKKLVKISNQNEEEKKSVKICDDSNENSEDIERKFTDITTFNNSEEKEEICFNLEFTPNNSSSSTFFSTKGSNKICASLFLNKNKKFSKLLTENWTDKIDCLKFKVFKGLNLLAAAYLETSNKRISKIFLKNMIMNAPEVEKILVTRINIKPPLNFKPV